MSKKELKKTFSTLLMMVIGGGVGFMAATIGMESAKSASTFEVVAFIILFVPGFFFVIAVHEAGHAIAGTLVNFNFRLYVVGPFMWDKEDSGWKFKWNKNLNVAGGLVICIPSSTQNLAKRFSVYSLGGPTASAVLVLLAYGAEALLTTFNATPNLALNVAISFFSLICFLSLIIFIATIVPMHTGGFYTDGARALRFLRGGDVARFETLLMSLVTRSYGGIRPGHLEKDEIIEALTLGKKVQAKMKVYTLYYLFNYAFDNNNIEEAEAFLKEYLADAESIPKGLRGSVYLDAVFFYAFAAKDLGQAEHYWKMYVPSAIIPKAQILAAEAAMLSLNSAGKEKAIETIERAVNELPNMMDRGNAIALKEKLNELKVYASTQMNFGPSLDASGN